MNNETTNNNNNNIFSKRGTYKKSKNYDDKQITKYYNQAYEENFKNNQVSNQKDESEIKKNEMKTQEMRNQHMNDLNEYYQKNKQEIDLKLVTNKNKISVALLFGYDGTGFHGLGYSKDLKYPAIENLLEKVLFKCGHILPSNVGEIKRIKWSKSSRTDKGVHSLSTVISCFLVVSDEIFNSDSTLPIQQSFIDDINSLLPNGIRLFTATRVSRSFQARKKGNERSYHYLVPKEHLAGIDPLWINKILSSFIGVNSFHNYTGKRLTYTKVKNNHSDDEDEDEGEGEDEINDDSEKVEDQVITHLHTPSNRMNEKLTFRNNSTNIRIVKSFYMENELVDNRWYKFVVIGESFITFQIRKMMGFFFSVVKGYQPLEALEISMSPFSVNVPTAPPFSLYLYDVIFDCSTPSKDDTCKNNKHIDTIFNQDQIKQLQNQFLINTLIPRFNQIEFETNQFQQFFNYLETKHQYNLNDLKLLIELNKEYQIEKQSRKEEGGIIVNQKQKQQQSKEDRKIKK